MPYRIVKTKNGYKVCKADMSKCFSKKPLPKETAEKQMKAIIINETKTGGKGLCCLMEGSAKPLTARLGGKVLLKKQIVRNFFPNPVDYNTYVEPFVGGGSVYFFKDKNDHKEVVNDIDPNIYTIFKGFQKYDAEKIANEVNGDYDKADFKKLLEYKPSDDFGKFIKTFLINRLSYFARGKTFGKPRINSTFKGYKDRLEDATILNEDYKKVIQKYDAKNTFFYLDPPYAESQSEFYYPSINLKELQQVLAKIKGKFLLSFPDIKEAKDMFKDKYHIYEIKTKYVGRRQLGGQTIPSREILVSNYVAPMKGGAKPLDMELYNKVKDEIYKKNPKHSLFRSAQVVKEYKKRGGKYDDEESPKMNIRKWFKQRWISLNDYYHDDTIIPCGNSDTYEKFNEYPLCRPLELAKKLGKEKIGKMLKQKEGPEPLRTENVLGTKKYNIKPTVKGGAIMPDGGNVSGLNYDTTGMPQDVIDSLPKDRYKKPRAVFEWRYANDPAFKEKVIENYMKSKAESEAYKQSDEYKKQVEWGKTVDVKSLFEKKTGPSPPHDLSFLTPEKRAEYDKLNEEYMAKRNAEYEYNSPMAVHNRKVAEWNAEMRRRKDSPFTPIVEGLTKAGDFLVGKVAPLIGVPSIVTNAYKNFAPPGSEYYQEGSLEQKAKGMFGLGMDKFHKQLAEAGLTHESYMKAVKKLAKASGYDPKKVEMSDDGKHKLVYHSPEGLKRFGRVGYGDYIIWSAKEKKGDVKKGYADMKRNTFRKSHGAMSKLHNLGKFSPNELSINLLW